MKNPTPDADASHQCDAADCFVPRSRRDFLRGTALTVAGALVAVGMNRADALAMPIELARGTSRDGKMKMYAMPAADGAQIDKDEDVILVRSQNAVYAFILSCPHQNTALKWDDHDHEFQCPKHHSRYTPDGKFIDGRA